MFNMFIYLFINDIYIFSLGIYLFICGPPLCLCMMDKQQRVVIDESDIHVASFKSFGLFSLTLNRSHAVVAMELN